jgi:hypothetical protein
MQVRMALFHRAIISSFRIWKAPLLLPMEMNAGENGSFVMGSQ